MKLNFSINDLKCLDCKKSALFQIDQGIQCKNCKKIYKQKNGKIIFTDNFIKEENWDDLEKNKETFFLRTKLFVNKIEGPKIKDLRKLFGVTGLSINLGGGKDKIENFVNLDLGDYKNVDVIADLKNIPFRDSSVYLVASNSVLEHIYDYKSVISEIHRILVKDGFLYLCVPSVCRQHHSIDYHRWTAAGLKKLIDDKFNFVETGVTRGIPHFLVMYIHYVIDLKIRNKILRSILKFIWNVLSLPLFLIREDHSNSSQSLAQTIYIIGKKK